MKSKTAVLVLLTMLVAGAIAAARPLDAQPRGAVRTADALARDGDEGSRSGGVESSDDAEIIVGTISCGTGPIGSEVPLLGLRFGGSIPLQNLGGIYENQRQMVEVTLPPAPTCAEILQQGAERVNSLGCTAGPVETNSESFVCSAERTKLVSIMAKLTGDVLHRGF